MMYISGQRQPLNAWPGSDRSGKQFNQIIQIDCANAKRKWYPAIRERLHDHALGVVVGQYSMAGRDAENNACRQSQPCKQAAEFLA